MITSRSAKVLTAAIKQVVGTYRKRGFQVKHVLGDGEFEPLRNAMTLMGIEGFSDGITLNTGANDKHIPVIERYIRTVKERTRCVFNTLPFQLMPHRLTIEMVYNSVLCQAEECPQNTAHDQSSLG